MNHKLNTRRISAVRDYPPFCGRNAPNPIQGNCTDTVKGIPDKATEEPEGFHDAEALIGKADLRKASLCFVVARDIGEGAILTSKGDFSGEDQGTVAVSSEVAPQHSTGRKQLPEFDHKLKTRRVTAVRDYPPFCGRNASNPIQGNCMDTVKVIPEKARALTDETEGVYDAESLIGKSGLRKASLCSIEVRDIGGSALETSRGDFSGENQGTVSVYSEVAPQHSTPGKQLPDSNVTLQPFDSDGSSRGDAYGKVRRKRDACTEKVSHKSEASREAMIKKITISMAADEGEDAYGYSTEVPPEALRNGPRARKLNVVLPPFCANASCHSDARSKVRETLRLFQLLCRRLLKGEEKSSPEEEGQPRQKLKRIDLEAAKMVKKKGKEVNTENIILGEVPGIEVGDEFQYRVELALVGVHRLYQAGIDSVKHPDTGMPVAVSIVASGAYADDMDDPDVLVYSGQGGNVVGKCKIPEDQKLEKGNLALRNSISVKNPVRVIRGYKEIKPSESVDAKPKVAMTYVYDGLYTVTNYWTEGGQHGKMVFMFELRRNPGQTDVFWKEVKSSKRSTRRHGVCVDDITGGKELLPICAINRIDGEKPPHFKYIRKMRYSEWFRPCAPKGCNCTGKCSDSKKCACAIQNGGEIPYNRNGAIVEIKPIVYECGPYCKCPPSCYNRVSQNGIKIQLEIFKTELRGWGVRSLTSIPSGTFICEYVGELLEDKEAERRIGNDEYLFDIGQKRTDGEQVDEVGYTIDAAEFGNVGRFINHSCSPNLYAQDVLYDYEDENMPHIMLFAADNIPPLQELTYDYNYGVDQVRDSNGNIVVKKCFCGSARCTGRLY